VNPTVKPPPPVIVQDAEDRIVEGAALSTHVTSAVKPVPVPLTTAPAPPDVGVRSKVGVGPGDTVKLSVAESPEPAFVVTITV